MGCGGGVVDGVGGDGGGGVWGWGGGGGVGGWGDGSFHSAPTNHLFPTGTDNARLGLIQLPGSQLPQTASDS